VSLVVCLTAVAANVAAAVVVHATRGEGGFGPLRITTVVGAFVAAVVVWEWKRRFDYSFVAGLLASSSLGFPRPRRSCSSFCFHRATRHAWVAGTPSQATLNRLARAVLSEMQAAPHLRPRGCLCRK